MFFFFLSKVLLVLCSFLSCFVVVRGGIARYVWLCMLFGAFDLFIIWLCCGVSVCMEECGSSVCSTTLGSGEQEVWFGGGVEVPMGPYIP